MKFYADIIVSGLYAHILPPIYCLWEIETWNDFTASLTGCDKFTCRETMSLYTVLEAAGHN